MICDGNPIWFNLIDLVIYTMMIYSEAYLFINPETSLSSTKHSMFRGMSAELLLIGFLSFSHSCVSCSRARTLYFTSSLSLALNSAQKYSTSLCSKSFPPKYGWKAVDSTCKVQSVHQYASKCKPAEKSTVHQMNSDAHLQLSFIERTNRNLESWMAHVHKYTTIFGFSSAPGRSSLYMPLFKATWMTNNTEVSILL